MSRLFESLNEPLFGKGAVAEVLAADELEKGGPGSGPHPGSGKAREAARQTSANAKEESAKAKAVKRPGLGASKTELQNYKDVHGAAARAHVAASNAHQKAGNEKQASRHDVAAYNHRAEQYWGMRDSQRTETAYETGDLDKGNSSRTANELGAGIFTPGEVEELEESPVKVDDDMDLEKGGPGSGPHPGHAKAGEQSEKARVASLIAGQGARSHPAVEAHHKAAARAYFSAADHYQRLADAHEAAGSRHTRLAEASNYKAEMVRRDK